MGRHRPAPAVKHRHRDEMGNPSGLAVRADQGVRVLTRKRVPARAGGSSRLRTEAAIGGWSAGERTGCRRSLHHPALGLGD
jgi:hypothetical protein